MRMRHHVQRASDLGWGLWGRSAVIRGWDSDWSHMMRNQTAEWSLTRGNDAACAARCLSHKKWDRENAWTDYVAQAKERE